MKFYQKISKKLHWQSTQPPSFRLFQAKKRGFLPNLQRFCVVCLLLHFQFLFPLTRALILPNIKAYKGWEDSYDTTDKECACISARRMAAQ